MKFSSCFADILLQNSYPRPPLSSQQENIGDLLIVNAQLSQAGIFTCTAQTVVDSASASARLVVRGKRSTMNRHEHPTSVWTLDLQGTSLLSGVWCFL